MSFFCSPAFIAHALSAICLALGIAILALNYKRILRFHPVFIGMILVALSFGIAQHGQSHAALEQTYGYSPRLC